jgi:hypothetical protein
MLVGAGAGPQDLNVVEVRRFLVAASILFIAARVEGVTSSLVIGQYRGGERAGGLQIRWAGGGKRGRIRLGQQKALILPH